LIALALGIFFCGKAAGWLREFILELDWFPAGGVTVISYIAGFLLIIGVLTLAGEIVHRVVGATPLGLLNHLMGGMFGLGVMMLFLSLLLNTMEVMDSHSVLISHQTKIESRFYYTIKQIVATIYPHNLFTLSKG
ncbi:MAG: CvpA family protein, partial [Tannerellaceae bacterium]